VNDLNFDKKLMEEEYKIYRELSLDFNKKNK
jgi:hypothetical protein